MGKKLESWIDKKQVIPLVISLAGLFLAYYGLSIQISSIVPNRPVLDIYPAEYLENPPVLSAQCLSDRNVCDIGQKVRISSTHYPFPPY